MSTYNICFHEEIRKISIFLVENIFLSGADEYPKHMFHKELQTVSVFWGCKQGLI